MDWKEAEKAELSSFYGRGASFMLIATRTAELLAARGGTMTAPQMEAFRAQLEQDDTSRVADDWREDILAHIAAQGARVAVLEAENERLRKSADELQRQRDSSNESLEHMRERLTAAEEGNRELVRRAQQAEGERDAALKLAERRRQERYDALNAKTTEGLSAAEWQLRTGKAERERDELKARCATLSAAGQVLSNVADRTGEPEENAPADDGCDLCGQHGGGHGYMPTQYDEVPQKCPKATTRYPCSATCTHEDGAEAMRAACLNVVQRVAETLGLGPTEWEMFKSAIEGAAP